MKVYISGKITGLQMWEVNKKFEAAERKLKNMGLIVINPVKLHEGKLNMDWIDYMKVDIKALVDCDAVYMLPCWTKSRGAIIEFLIAYLLGLIIMNNGLWQTLVSKWICFRRIMWR